MEVQGAKDGAAQRKRTKRGRWTAEQRQEIVAASFVAGASINEVAQRFGIRPNLLTAWRRRAAREIATAKPERKRARFAAVRINGLAMDGTIEIDQANGLVRVRGIVDAGMLREVLAATRRSDYPMVHGYGSHAVSPICAMGSMALQDSCRPSSLRIRSRVSSLSFAAGVVTA